MDTLQILKTSNFDWTVMLQNVWAEAEANVEELNSNILSDFRTALERLQTSEQQTSPPAWVISGKAGSGKTHTLRQFRKICSETDAVFVLVDMTDVRDFWETTLLGYFTSLQQLTNTQRPQFELVIERLFGQFMPSNKTRELVDIFKSRKLNELKVDCQYILKHLAKRFNSQVNLYGDTVRALLALNSNDYLISSVGSTWLQGESITPEQKVQLGMSKERETSRRIVEGLAWVMSFSGPTIVSFDQLDPIINQFQINALCKEEDSEDARVARIILNGVGAGFSALRDATANFRTLIILSCVEMSWDTLKKSTLGSYIDRFDEPRILGAVSKLERVEDLVQCRLNLAYRSSNFKPPYATWPFPQQALRSWSNDSPREILKRCHAHVAKCIRAGKVIEFSQDIAASVNQPELVEQSILRSGSDQPIVDYSTKFSHFDREFEFLKSKADILSIVDETNEDTLFADLIENALQCALLEADLPESVDGLLDNSFSGGSQNKPLHARLKLVFNDDNGREDHVCYRVIQRSNASALQSRLKGALIQSGIDRALPFRHLYVIRSTPFPNGKVTRQLVQDFISNGGVQLTPQEDDVRALYALSEMKKRNTPGWTEWLQSRRYISCKSFLSESLPELFNTNCPRSETESPKDLSESAITEQIDALEALLQTPGTASSTVSESPAPSASKAQSALSQDVKTANPQASAPAIAKNESRVIPSIHVGRRIIAKSLGEELSLRVGALDKHAVVFGGAGSGKTVLLKRLIEEAALARIPSIVLDCANDLCSLGVLAQNRQSIASDADLEKANRLANETETVLWTPLLNSGNPLGFAPLPDLTSLVDNEDELNEAINMAEEALRGSIIRGTESVKQLKSAVLTQVLRYLAMNGNCNLETLGEILADLPPDFAMKISEGRKLATQMADALHAEMINNRMLLPGQPTMDPRVLLGDDKQREKTRISVVNFAGLTTAEMQRQFINQLAMTLFAWIKKNPNPPDRPLRGLLIIDEARDFIPSGGSSSCMGSIRRLAAQARKYKLGVVFATQNPKDIDSKIIGQCSTQWYGKMNSPVAIKTANEMLRDRGLQGADTASLTNGTFYISNPDEFPMPTKIKTSLCLSEHGTPWELPQVIQRAVSSSSATKGS